MKIEFLTMLFEFFLRFSCIANNMHISPLKVYSFLLTSCHVLKSNSPNFLIN